jgi:hypothetical protein
MQTVVRKHMDTTKAIEDLKMPTSISRKFGLAFAPTLLIGALLFSFFITCERPYPHFHPFSFFNLEDLLTAILFALLLLFSIYNLTQFGNYSKLVPVYSNLEIESKREIIKSLTQIFKWKYFETGNSNYFEFLYTKHLFGMSFLVNILIDENGFYVNVGHKEFRLPAIYFYKVFERKIIKQVNQLLSP